MRAYSFVPAAGCHVRAGGVCDHPGVKGRAAGRQLDYLCEKPDVFNAKRSRR